MICDCPLTRTGKPLEKYVVQRLRFALFIIYTGHTSDINLEI